MSTITKLKVSARTQNYATLKRHIIYSKLNTNILPSCAETGGVRVAMIGCIST